MTDAMFMPCDDWSEKLATPREDLMVSDRVALETHLASCPICSLINIDDDMISKLIRTLPAPDFPSALPPRLLRLREKAGKQEPQTEVVPQLGPERALTEELQLLREELLREELLRVQSYLGNEKLASETFTSKQLPSQSGVDRHSKDVSPPRPLPLPGRGEPVDQVLYCRDCGQEFTFTIGEQEFYASRGLTMVPTRCPSCHAARKGASGGKHRSRGGRDPSQIYTVICSGCGKETEVPFLPRGDRPVYCKDCSHSQGTVHYHHRHKWDR